MRCRLPPPSWSIRSKRFVAHQSIHEFAGLWGPFLPAPLGLRAAMVERWLASGARCRGTVGLRAGVVLPIRPDERRRPFWGVAADVQVGEGNADRSGGICGREVDAVGWGDVSWAATARLRVKLALTVFFERDMVARDRCGLGGRTWGIHREAVTGCMARYWKRRKSWNNRRRRRSIVYRLERVLEKEHEKTAQNKKNEISMKYPFTNAPPQSPCGCVGSIWRTAHFVACGRGPGEYFPPGPR